MPRASAEDKRTHRVLQVAGITKARVIDCPAAPGRFRQQHKHRKEGAAHARVHNIPPAANDFAPLPCRMLHTRLVSQHGDAHTASSNRTHALTLPA